MGEQTAAVVRDVGKGAPLNSIPKVGPTVRSRLPLAASLSLQ
jgi:hypothetical protein